MFADEAKRKKLDITVGEEVITIGYPLGLRQENTNLPLVHQGLIATKIGELLRDKVPAPGGGFRNRPLRAFLIDGATVQVRAAARSHLSRSSDGSKETRS